MYNEKYFNKELYRELIKQSFTWFPINRWSEHFSVLVYDSDIYSFEISIVFSNSFEILYYGYDASEAYYSRKEPKELSLKNIYYVRSFEDDSYIFFYKDGTPLNGDYVFDKMDNDYYDKKGEIIARAEDGRWHFITKDGVKDAD